MSVDTVTRPDVRGAVDDAHRGLSVLGERVVLVVGVAILLLPLMTAALLMAGV